MASKKRKRQTIAGALVITGLFIALVIYLEHRSSISLEHIYDSYVNTENAYVVAAFKPAAAENPIRTEIDRLLSLVLLQSDLTSAERLHYAQTGIAHLKDIEKEVDDIKNAKDAL